MQISPITSLSSPVPAKVVYAKEPERVAPPTQVGFGVFHGVDFSRITPRQLQALCDDLIFNGGEAGFEDAVDLGNALPSGVFFEHPDTPIDLRAQIEGMVEFGRSNGFDALATLYSGLLERMTLMEARSVHLSVVA